MQFQHVEVVTRSGAVYEGVFGNLPADGVSFSLAYPHLKVRSDFGTAEHVLVVC